MLSCGSLDGGGTGTGGGSASPGTGWSGTSESDRQALSGTRLKVRYVQGTDGSKSFIGFRDTMLNANCSFTFADDGQQHCLPSDVAFVSDYFADSGCSQMPLAEAQTGCAGLTYATALLQVCPIQQSIYSVTQTATPNPLYYGTPGHCQMLAAPANYVFYAVGAKVSASDFVSGTEMVEQ